MPTPAPTKTSSTKRKAHTLALKNKIAALEAQVSAQKETISTLAAAVKKGAADVQTRDERIQERDSRYYQLLATYKRICKLFYRAALRHYTQADPAETLDYVPPARSARLSLAKQPLADAELAADKEFNKILTAVGNHSLGRDSYRHQHDDDETDVDL